MAAMPRETEPFYTPQVVERLLRQLPYLLDRTTPPDDNQQPRRGKRTSPAGRLEEQMAKRADVEWALCQLPQPWYQTVYLTCVGNKSWEEVAEVIDRTTRTVARRKVDGLCMIAWLLGWRDSDGKYGPENYVTVMRRIYGNQYRG